MSTTIDPTLKNIQDELRDAFKGDDPERTERLIKELLKHQFANMLDRPGGIAKVLALMRLEDGLPGVLH